MIDPELLEILVCPETKQSVRVADDELLARVNHAIDQGGLASRGGQTVSEPIQGGLVREDDQVLYPIRDEIPIMLVDEAIPLDALG